MRAMCVALFIPAAAASGSTWYVWSGAAAGGSGLSWSSPMNSLQDALAAASAGDEIRMGPGVYKPGPAGSPRTVTFAIPSGVAVRGGYAGPGAPDPDVRDLAVFITTLSGDLFGNDGANFTNYADNTHHVVTITSGDSATVLDGVTVRSGANASQVVGAGVAVTSGAPVLIDCVFTANDGASTGGGGVGLTGSLGQIVRCRFIGNRVQGAGAGAGLQVRASGPDVIDCLFDSNVGGQGAGAGNKSGSHATYLRCTFSRNTGSISLGNGPGMYDEQSDTTVDSCRFIRNTTGSGGGGVFSAGAGLLQIRNSVFIGNTGTADGGGAIYTIGANNHVTITNCLFSGNRSDLASGTTMFVGTGSLVEVVNSTIVNSGLGQGFGAVSSNPGTVKLYNSILWNSRGTQGGGFGAHFFNTPSVIDRCCIEGWPGGGTSTGALPRFVDLDGPDNIAGNDDDNTRLMPGSPCIDAAANTWLPSSIAVDLDGLARLVDDPGTPDTGVGAAPLVDIGCYEFQGVTCYANCDGSTTVPILNALDFGCYLNAFAAGGAYANCDGSTTSPVLNALDFGCFLTKFAAGCS